jgi:glycosyltransferase involved in cell wall biosynthesis
MTPFFSIIIPVYNGMSHDLPICLEHIWNQTLGTCFYEVICVDDCSRDETFSWLQEQSKLHANLRLMRNCKNIRQGGGEIEVSW